MIYVKVVDPNLLAAYARLHTERARVNQHFTTCPKIGLIETPLGYILTNDEGIHTAEPYSVHQSVPFYHLAYSEREGRDAWRQDASALEDSNIFHQAEVEISIEALLIMCKSAVPLAAFVPNYSARLIANYRLLLATLDRYDVDEAQIEEARAARIHLSPHGEGAI